MYCLNNPLRWIDKDGRDPGDPFKSRDDAAKDFAKYYNGNSIVRNKEFGSIIYSITLGNGEIQYSYNVANIGWRGSVSIPLTGIPEGATLEATAHTHGKFEPIYDNENFSPKDKKSAKSFGLDDYVATPEGQLKKWDVKSEKQGIIKDTKDIPSDPNTPDRKTKVDPQNTNPMYNDPWGVDEYEKNKMKTDEKKY